MRRIRLRAGRPAARPTPSADTCSKQCPPSRPPRSRSDTSAALDTMRHAPTVPAGPARYPPSRDARASVPRSQDLSSTFNISCPDARFRYATSRRYRCHAGRAIRVLRCDCDELEAPPHRQARRTSVRDCSFGATCASDRGRAAMASSRRRSGNQRGRRRTGSARDRTDPAMPRHPPTC